MGDNLVLVEQTPRINNFQNPEIPRPPKRKQGLLNPGLPISNNVAGPHSVHLPKTYGTTSKSIFVPSQQVNKSDSPAQRKISRALTKKGNSNVSPTSFSSGLPFLQDTFTTLLEVSWIWTLSVFIISYLLSWLFFAGIWYLIVFEHGDLHPLNVNNDSWSPCISGMKDFTSAILFSIETQHTTGYGYYHITEQCPMAVIVLCTQSIFGVILEGILVGLVFVKMARAKSRSATILFSKNSLVSQRDGGLCFMFRIADQRKSHLLDVSVRAQLVKRCSVAGEEVTISQEELQVNGEGEKDNKLLLFWPTTVIHRINRTSPLYRLSAADLTPENTKFEIIVVLEGIVEATGLLTQARSSYMPSEILWGYRFKNLTSKKSKTGERIIDFSNFHEVYQVPTSPLSVYQINSLSST